MFSELQSFYNRVIARKIFMHSRLVVYEGLLNMLTAGVSTKTPTFSAQFEIWTKRARSRGQGIWRAYSEIQKRLSSGHGLAKSMSPFIPTDEEMIIDAGEASGKLIPTLESLIKSVEATRDMEESTRAAYKEPMIALVSFIALSWFSGYAVWPPMMEALSAKYWDGWSLVMIYSQIFMYQYTSSVVLIFVLFGIYKYSLPRWVGKPRIYAEKLFPFFASYRDKQAASLLIVLSGLLRSGKTMDQALVHISRKGSPYVRWHTRSMQRRMITYAGDPSKMLATGIFNDEILDRISNAAASRQLAETIQLIGSESIDQVVKTVKNSASLGAAIMFVFVGLLLSYYTAVQVIGAQMAADRYMREVKSGAFVSVQK